MAGERILVIEDETRIAEVLELFLRAEGFHTERAADGLRALEYWRVSSPDLILLDLMIPGVGGLEVLRTIRRTSAVPVLIVTARVEDVDRLVGLELGADDYILKPFNPREVVARVKAVLRRTTGQWNLPKRYVAGPVVVDMDLFQAYCQQEPLSLTALQFRLLAKLAAHPGKAFSRSELLDVFEGEAPDERTIDAHIKNLRSRMNGCGERLETVRGVGYRLKP